MAEHHIAHIELDEATIIRRNADIERERAVAIADLIAENSFHSLRATELGCDGPYRLRLSVRDGRLVFDIASEDGRPLQMLVLGLARFNRVIREYFAICDSYYRTVRGAVLRELETVDMARRGLHDRGARLLMERLDGKVEMDLPTARRLFTLICVLHIKG